MKTFDAIIIGAGQAGAPLAGRLASEGRKVALVERKHLGGTCVNTGCKPTKTLVASARVGHMAFRAADFGVILESQPRIDMAKVRARAQKVIVDSREGIEGWLGAMPTLKIYRTHARFASPNVLRVGDEDITAPQIFINVGGRPSRPDLPGIGEIEYLTSSSILDLDFVPDHLVVVGGSYIGLEFAQMYRRFGSNVTIIERQTHLLPREDEVISSAIASLMQSEGIGLRTNANCIAFSKHPDGVSVRVDCEAGSPEVVGSHVLLAMGRTSNTDDLGLDATGVVVDSHGFITVDDELRTNVAGIWALGDCNGRGAFTHTSYNDFEIIAANLLDGGKRKVTSRIPAYALYIDPPLGRVGMTEKEARASGRNILVSDRLMTNVGRAVERDETKGLMTVVADADTHEILGAAILGIEGDEAIHGILDVMNGKNDYRTFQWAVPIHPTVSELIPTLMGGLKPPPGKANSQG
ncbi:FAD-containing oxidoreductase [Rhizobium sp. KVB221]|uniref:FAD-containing oxidoreductase n=1 Tax=Rhizobium setariae TaxID=2801340 RepID=A0A937CNE7_9HYPH|nr:FAD-containing oxidoreductase [Rhizobium setariae]MBL0371108.1 FAD-containing oxidoreductase [Rhizobium setariae]